MAEMDHNQSSISLTFLAQNIVFLLFDLEQADDFKQI